MKKKILLVEPGYRNKYPPLGLMKIATGHLLNNNKVTFQKGLDSKIRSQRWHAIYITTLFTFFWKKTIDTIKYYSRANGKLYVGGIMASLMPSEIFENTKINPHIGPLNNSFEGILNKTKIPELLQKSEATIQRRGIDALPPDYSIFEGQELPYNSILNNSYITRTTRGCSRACDFCGVTDLEPDFIERIELSDTLNYIINKFGEKQNLLLLDDNLLLSPKFDEIIDEIKDLGFQRGARLSRCKRIVDYNQGLDIRLLNKNHLKKLFEISLKPLRLAFDDYNLRTCYVDKIMMAIDAGFKEISSYILYNYKDTPSELYKRLIIACEINEKYTSRIYSFPMKYIPCDEKDRKHIGREWSRRQIRGVQCILNATHGIAPTRPDFLLKAFGESIDDFLRIIQMPENYIIYRSENMTNGCIDEWKNCYNALSISEKKELLHLISGGKTATIRKCSNKKINDILVHYKNENVR